MYFEDERNAIESRFRTKWLASAYSTVPIYFQNREFDPAGASYVSCIVKNATAQQISLGSPAIHRYIGVIINDILVKVNKGTKPSKDMADAISEIWRNAQFSKNNSGRILCRTPRIVDLGRRGDYQQHRIETEYERDVSLTTQPAG